jgi:hypothetical protein
MPQELMFLDSFYKPQTLSSQRLEASSFVDPLANETIFTRLPDLVTYYLTRWSHQNLISTFKECVNVENQLEEDFEKDPRALLDQFHARGLGPFADMGDKPPSPPAG